MSQSGNQDDLFQIAAKAEKLLQEILSAGKKSPQANPVKQEPQVHVNLPQQQTVQPQVQQQVQQQNGQFYPLGNSYYPTQVPQLSSYSQFGYPPPGHQNYPPGFIRHPPPNAHLIQVGNVAQPSLYYQMGQQPQQQQPQFVQGIQQYHTGYGQQHIQQQQRPRFQAPPVQYYTSPYMQQQQQYPFNHSLPPPVINSFFHNNKRKFGEINNYTNNNSANNNVNSRSNSENSYNSYQGPRKHTSTNGKY